MKTRSIASRMRLDLARGRPTNMLVKKIIGSNRCSRTKSGPRTLNAIGSCRDFQPKTCAPTPLTWSYSEITINDLTLAGPAPTQSVLECWQSEPSTVPCIQVAII